jgi:hypothetical protein
MAPIRPRAALHFQSLTDVLLTYGLQVCISLGTQDSAALWRFNTPPNLRTNCTAGRRELQEQGERAFTGVGKKRVEERSVRCVLMTTLEIRCEECPLASGCKVLPKPLPTKPPRLSNMC